MIRSGMQALLVALGGALLLTGCGDDGGGTEPPPPVDYDAIDPVVFSQHIQPVFTASCNTAACHNDVDRAAGLRLTSYDATAQGSTFAPQVLPFHPERSHLYNHMTGAIEPRMPLALDPLSDGAIRTFSLTPETVGLRRHDRDALRGGDAAFNASALRALLGGAEGAYRDTVLMNAGAGLVVAGKAAGIEEGVRMAARALDEGAAARALERLVAISNE